MATNENKNGEGVTRRDFIHVAAGGVGAIAAASVVWPLVDQMNPSADVLALASIEVDLSSIERGGAVKVMWRGTPIYIRHRTEAEIAAAKADDSAVLPDPATDGDRVQKPEWMIMEAVCTHLGCVPVGAEGGYNGDFGGWFCPCHGSHYDTSGRIRKGPAPRNLAIPPYQFVADTTIVIG